MWLAFRLRVLLATLLLCTTTLASGADGVAEVLSKYRDELVKASEEILAIQSRMLAAKSEFLNAEAGFHYLAATGDRLSVAARECNVLLQTMVLTTLVTDEKALPMAQKILKVQIDHMVRTFGLAVKATEQGLPQSQNEEISTQMLRARDRLKAVSAFLETVHFTPKNAQ
jgi:hypothetical protein